MSYLATLTLRLAAGAMQLPEELRRRHVAFLTRTQTDDGGFAGREGPGDLYYTGFALRGMALAGQINEATGRKAADFLKQQLDRQLPSVDFLSLIYSAVLLELLADIDVFAESGIDRVELVQSRLEPLRREDGGYARTATGHSSSTYQTFLAVACNEMVGLPTVDSRKIVDWVSTRRREDGGFVEIGPMTRSGTNPTAAAIGLLRSLDALDETTRRSAAGFLAGMQTAEGGLRANTRIPVADLLSTFTGLVALADLDELPTVDLDAVRRYVHALALPDGGFRAGVWDATADAEYTFYGLGTLALVGMPSDES